MFDDVKNVPHNSKSWLNFRSKFDHFFNTRSSQNFDQEIAPKFL